jgi:hypothetical protein
MEWITREKVKGGRLRPRASIRSSFPGFRPGSHSLGRGTASELSCRGCHNLYARYYQFNGDPVTGKIPGRSTSGIFSRSAGFPD